MQIGGIYCLPTLWIIKELEKSTISNTWKSVSSDIHRHLKGGEKNLAVPHFFNPLLSASDETLLLVFDIIHLNQCLQDKKA